VTDRTAREPAMVVDDRERETWALAVGPSVGYGVLGHRLVGGARLIAFDWPEGMRPTVREAVGAILRQHGAPA
jgi:hypothetical protein